jgi:hypothetical protein
VRLRSARPNEIDGIAELHATNERARSFYDRHGWRPDGAARDAFGVREILYRSAVRRSAS